MTKYPLSLTLLALIFSFFLPVSLQAQGNSSEVLQFSNPGLYASSYNLDPRNFQVEGTFQFAHAPGNYTTTRWILPNIKLRLGISNRVELTLQNRFEDIERENPYFGLDFARRSFPGFHVGAQIDLTPATSKTFSMALRTAVFLPTQGLWRWPGEDWGDIHLLWISRTELTDRLALVANLGGWIGVSSGIDGRANLGLEYSCKNDWTGFVEGQLVYYLVARDREGGRIWSMDHSYQIGLTKAFSPAFTWRLFGGVTLNTLPPSEFFGRSTLMVGTGLAYRLVSKK